MRCRMIVLCCTVGSFTLWSAPVLAARSKSEVLVAAAVAPISVGRFGTTLRFEPGYHAAASDATFMARTRDFTLHVARNGFVVRERGVARPPRGFCPLEPVCADDSTAVGSEAVRITFLGSSPLATVAGVRRLAGVVNDYRGAPSEWRVNLPVYGSTRIAGLYPGVDLSIYGNGGAIEYDLVLSPGVDPQSIRFAISGDARGRIDDRGDLVVGLAGGELRMRKPLVYQDVDGVRRRVAGAYALSQDGLIAFRLAAYETARPLVIDPILAYSTYLGGPDQVGSESGNGIAVDPLGNAYVAGYTDSLAFPIRNALQDDYGGKSGNVGGDAFVTKFAADGTFVYSTYLGGSGDDEARHIAVDDSGNAYVVGNTGSADFPVRDALQPFRGGGEAGPPGFPQYGDGFLASLDPSGALVFSTYLGGSGDDRASVVATDGRGDVYVLGATQSSDFPVHNALQAQHASDGGEDDLYVMKLDPTGPRVTYSTYLGGNGDEGTAGIAADRSGNVVIAGSTDSTNFPTMNAIQPDLAGDEDAVVAKLTAAGSALVFSTYLGGAGEDEAAGVALDRDNNVWVVGDTDSADFPTKNPTQLLLRGRSDAFLTKIRHSGGSMLFSTFVGGSSSDSGAGIAVDPTGDVHIQLDTRSDDLPTLDAPQPDYAPGDTATLTGDTYVAKIDGVDLTLVYATYLGGGGEIGRDTAGGIAADAAGNTYVTGYTLSDEFPIANAVQPEPMGYDAFVARIGDEPLPEVTPAVCAGDCDGDQQVLINEIIKAVSIALGLLPPGQCTAADSNRDGQVTINEVIQAVNLGVSGCP